MARGFEESAENLTKDSPAYSRDVLCATLATIAQKNWVISTIDIKTAFLQGQPIDQ